MLESITFEPDGQLQSVEPYCFRFSVLKSVFIPKNVNFIEGSAFDVIVMKSISVHEQSVRFCMI
jgi:hypothetical protein